MKRAKNLTSAVYDTILEMMMNSRIIPGERLKFEQLAEKIGVSRTPVNNALHILAREGYLDFIPNRGYTVSRLTLEEMEYLLEVRTILEIGTISKSIRRITDEKLAAVEKAMSAYEHLAAEPDCHAWFILDAEFHSAIIAMTENHYLVEQYLQICRKIFLNFRPCAIRPGGIAREHRALFESIRIRDVESAKDLIKRHAVTFQRAVFLLSPLHPLQGSKRIHDEMDLNNWVDIGMRRDISKDMMASHSM